MDEIVLAIVTVVRVKDSLRRYVMRDEENANVDGYKRASARDGRHNGLEDQADKETVHLR